MLVVLIAYRQAAFRQNATYLVIAKFLGYFHF
jgi:hypothetical protein